jgi:hypothetical protein
MFSDRVDVLRELLERYHELVDPSIGTNGEKGNGEQPPEMPGAYTVDVKELERLLRLLRSARPTLWWHVSERYLRSNRAIRERLVKRKVKGKGVVVELQRVVWTDYSSRVDELLVDIAILWMADRWDYRREPRLPRGDKQAKFPWETK